MKRRIRWVFKSIFFICMFICLTSISTVVVRAQTGWEYNEDGNWYYYGEDGKKRTGWQKIGDNWFYFNNSGCWIDDNSAEVNTIKGIDVSKWQGDIEWNKVKDAGIEFSFIRIGHGNHILDKYYIQNMKSANEVEMPVGVYFSSTATTEEQAVLDARFVIENLQGYLVSYPVVIDLEDSVHEDLGKDKITDIAIAFCDEIRTAGYTPMVYCNENWYKNYIDFSRLENVERWIAQYNVVPSPFIERGIWQCGNTGRIPGINGNVDINFGNKDYTKIVTPRDAAISSYLETTGVWKENSVGRWYQYLDGHYPVDKWEKIDGKWYCFNKKGYVVTGWIKHNGSWYYMNSTGEITTGWVKDSGSWYYMNSSGEMTTGWVKDGGLWYYMNPNGEMATGWVKDSGKWYYMKPTGDMVTGWVKDSGSWYYMNSSGEMATGWIKDRGSWYYLYSNGSMASNTWVGSYYVDSTGVWTK